MTEEKSVPDTHKFGLRVGDDLIGEIDTMPKKSNIDVGEATFFVKDADKTFLIDTWRAHNRVNVGMGGMQPVIIGYLTEVETVQGGYDCTIRLVGGVD